MAISDILGFNQRFFQTGSPVITSPLPLGRDFQSAGSQIVVSATARLLASSESGSNGYFPGQNIVVADFDSPFIELTFQNLPQIESGEFRFRYVAPNVQDGDLSIEVFDAQGILIGRQSLLRTNGTYEILPSDIIPNASVRFSGTPSSIRIGGVLREFAIDNLQLESFITPPPNLPPETTNANITAAPGTTIQLTGLGGTDSDGTVLQFAITSLPAAGQGTLFLGNFAADGTPVTLNQIIPADQINNLFFQASTNFTIASFTYAAIDNQNAQDLSPATVTINPVGQDTGDIVVGNNVTGTSSSDVIGATSSSGVTGQVNANPPDRRNIATQFGDTIAGGDGGDRVNGLGGNDTLIGGSGRDTLNGNTDNDFLFADSLTQTAGGNDSLFGGQGADTLVGARFGFSADSLNGNAGNDLLISSTNGGNTLFGGQGNDTIYGSVSNSNTMNGDLGSDVLVAGNGNDRMLGADGNDTLIGGEGNNDMFGESGNDQFQFFTDIPQDLVAFTDAEQVVRSRGGFGGRDTIFDFSLGDAIFINGLDSYDTLSGGGFNNTVTITTNSAGAAVITVNGTDSSGQSTNRQSIFVVDVSGDQLLAPGSQQLAINDIFITTSSPNISNSGGTYTYFIP